MIETVSPESVGISSDRLQDIDIAMQRFVDEGKLAGITTLIARRGKVVHFGRYGKLDISANKPIQFDSVFRIYSLTKPITSVAALILYEEGYFDLNDPVSKWIPEFKNFKVLQESPNADIEPNVKANEMTIWHLLTHTSGLGYGFDSQPIEPIEVIYRDSKIFNKFVVLEISLPEVIQKISKLPLVAQPGEIWHYGLSHDVLGYLISLISGKPFDVYLRERVFEPLGMQDTSFFVPQGKLERFGPLYSAPEENGGLTVVDNVATSPFVNPNVAPSGGGGLVSSMRDYLRFLLMLAGGGALDGVRILKKSTVTAMTTNQLSGTTFPVRFNNEPWPDMGFGFGIGVQATDKLQIGWIGVSGTTAWMYPQQEMIVIAMPQSLFYWEASDTLLRMANEAIMI